MFKFVFCADTHRFNLGSTVPVCPVAVVGLGVVAEEWNCREVQAECFFCQMLLVQQIFWLAKGAVKLRVMCSIIAAQWCVLARSAVFKF